jgi:hypothetical protein
LWESFLGLVFFGILATSTPLAMELLAVLRPERADALLSSIRVWIDTHTAQIIVIVSFALGLWLTGYRSYLLVTS